MPELSIEAITIGGISVVAIPSLLRQLGVWLAEVKAAWNDLSRSL